MKISNIVAEFISICTTKFLYNFLFGQYVRKRRKQVLQLTLSDVLIVAGDIGTKIDHIRKTLEYLQTLFGHVFYCPGNNELRLHKGDTFSHSIRKFKAILNMCKEIGVHTTPNRVNGVWIGSYFLLYRANNPVPLFAWYTPYFDPDFDGDFEYQKHWLDFYKVKWPRTILDETTGPADYFLKLNPVDRVYNGPVISFSHFLPHFGLLPGRLWMKKTLSLVRLGKILSFIGINIDLYFKYSMYI